MGGVIEKLNHADLGLLAADDHSGHPWLAGRSGGQALIGGTGSAENLTLSSTAHGTKGFIYLGGAPSYFDEAQNNLILNNLCIVGSGIEHKGDSDTSIRFLTDRITMNIGGAVCFEALSGKNNFYGHVLVGNVSSGGDLKLQSTSHATKGRVEFGSLDTTYYDESDNIFYFGDGLTIAESKTLTFAGVGEPGVELSKVDNIGGTNNAVLNIRANGTNKTTSLFFMPKGAGGLAGFNAQMLFFGTDYLNDNTNYDLWRFNATGTSFELGVEKNGTGSLRPMIFKMDGTDCLTVETNNDISISNDLILIGSGSPTQNYKFITEDTYCTIQGSNTSYSYTLRMKDALLNRTKNTFIQLYNYESGSDTEYLQIGAGVSYHEVSTRKTTSGTLQPLHLFTGTATTQLVLNIDGTITMNKAPFVTTIKSGATQAGAGAAAGEEWITSGHATLPDNVKMHGV